jgi:hypothetical protein
MDMADRTLAGSRFTNRAAGRISLALAAVICIGVLTGCANVGNGQTPGAGGTATSGSAGTSGGPAPSATYLPPSGSGKSPEAGDQTLTGQVEAGVEPGCLLLRQSGKTYLLMSGDPSVVKAGASVVVTGHVTTGIMSYCQQGLPFTVTTARSN